MSEALGSREVKNHTHKAILRSLSLGSEFLLKSQFTSPPHAES